jgi:hypothetical protein
MLGFACGGSVQRIEALSNYLKEMAPGSTDEATGGTRRARPNIKMAASSVSPPIAMATAVIINPNPIAVIIIFCISSPSFRHLMTVLTRVLMICEAGCVFSPIEDNFKNSFLV